MALDIPPCVEADTEHGLGYIYCNADDVHADGSVVRTVEVGELAHLDFNAKGELVGVEILDLKVFERNTP